MAELWAFDADFTLENPTGGAGPVRLQQLVDLFNEGQMVGIAGNWPNIVKDWPSWHRYISFFGPYKMKGDPMSPFKADMLKEIKANIPADRYVLVGNIMQPNGQIADLAVADAAGFEFIKEYDFANGLRQVDRNKYPKVPGIKPWTGSVGNGKTTGGT